MIITEKEKFPLCTLVARLLPHSLTDTCAQHPLFINRTETQLWLVLPHWPLPIPGILSLPFKSWSEVLNRTHLNKTVGRFHMASLWDLEVITT